MLRVAFFVQLQAYTARRAERSAEEQAREQNLAAQARQREHEQMLSQIVRCVLGKHASRIQRRCIECSLSKRPQISPLFATQDRSVARPVLPANTGDAECHESSEVGPSAKHGG